MKNQIVLHLQPFIRIQQINVFKDGDKEVIDITLDKVNEKVCEVAKENNIKLITLIGPKQYCRGMKRHLYELGLLEDTIVEVK